MVKKFYLFLLSLPAWGAWIEMDWLSISTPYLRKSLPAWGAWIEIQLILPTRIM